MNFDQCQDQVSPDIVFYFSS